MQVPSFPHFEFLLIERPLPHVLMVTINNPAKMNAVSYKLHHELVSVFKAIDDDSETRVAIVTGAGKAFCAGGSIDDMPSVAKLDKNGEFNQGFTAARELVDVLISLRKPLISAINGPAIGAGLAIALLADIPIADRTAKMFDGHLRVGVAAGDHAAMVWPLLCGLAKSKYHLLTNTPLTGEEAERINLVALAVNSDELMPKALELAERLANTAPTALRMSKYVLNHYLRQNQAIFDLSAAFEMVNFGSDENVAAMKALSARETPVFETTREEFR